MLISTEILMPVDASIATIALSRGLVALAMMLFTSSEVKGGSTLLTILGALSFLAGFVLIKSISERNSKYLFALPTLLAIVAVELLFSFIWLTQPSKSTNVISLSSLPI